MALKDQMAADVAAIFLNTSEFAESITYNGMPLLAIVELGEDRADGNEFTNEGLSARATVWISASDVPTPCQGDIIIRNSDLSRWEVARVVESGGGMHRLLCVSRQSVGWR